MYYSFEKMGDSNFCVKYRPMRSAPTTSTIKVIAPRKTEDESGNEMRSMLMVVNQRNMTVRRAISPNQPRIRLNIISYFEKGEIRYFGRDIHDCGTVQTGGFLETTTTFSVLVS